MPKFTTYSLLLFLCCLSPAITLAAEKYDPATELEYLNRLYEQLHADPELSFYEASTSQRIVSELDIPGLVVTNNVGGHGVVAVLKNGEGPTLMLRADMDALPVEEKTGLEYASKVTFKDANNNVLPVMHACGHDMHMTVLTGAVRRLTAERDAWQGTLLIVYQPAEERGAGARMMLDDGLFERFPRPDFNLTMHTSAELPAGKIGYTSGYTMANVDSVDILIRGVGGHGAYPHKTKDPVTIAAHLIVQLQTIVSRETSPLKATVITIGSIHGGSKHNIISDEVKLQLTVRSYSDETRRYLLKRIREVSEGVARTAGMPDELLPIVTIKEKYTPSVHNDPALTAQIVSILQNEIGEENIIAVPPVMGGEDFSRYGRVDPPIPSALLWLGSVSPERFELSLSNEIELPALHSPEFAPLPRPTIETGVKAMTGIVRKLLAIEP